MPNCIIKGLQDKLWVSYSNYSGDLENSGDLEIDSIYLDSDPERTDIYDYLSWSMLEKAYTAVMEDWEDLKADEAHERYKCARYYDEQGGWI